MVNKIVLDIGIEYFKGSKESERCGSRILSTSFYKTRKNGGAERLNRIINNGAWMLLIQAGAPAGF